MSDSKDSTVTYTVVSSPFEDRLDIANEILPAEEQPLPAAASPTADSLGYVLESDPEEEPEANDDEDLEEDPPDYPADRDDDDEEEEPSEDDADEDEDLEEEEEHPAPADSVPPVHRMTAMISIRDDPSISLPPREEVKRLLALTTPPPSPLTLLSSPLPQIPFPPLPGSSPASVLPTSPPASPIRPLGYRAAMIRLRAEAASTSHSLPLPPPLHLLSTDCREDKPDVCLPPRKRLCSTQGPRYEVGESSSAAAARPIGGRRVDYGFVDTMDTEIRRQRAEEVSYGIRDVWVDPREAVEEVAPMTLERVNTRVTELATVQKQDKQDIYATARLLDQEALVSREAWGRSMEVSYMARSEIMALRSIVMSQQTVISQLQAADRRSQTVTSEMLQADHMRQAEIAALRTFDRTRQEQLVQTLTLMQSLQGQVTTLQGQVTALQGQQGPSGGPAQPVAPEEAGSVTAALAARDATRNGDDSHTSRKGVRKTERVAREIVGQDVAYAMTWTYLRKKMTDKYCLRNEIKKLKVEMFPEESDKVERYVGGLPDMIQRSVVASKLKTMQEATEMVSELMDKKINIIAERQAENKRKLMTLPRTTRTITA
ncbi:hypothetical protein Tco_0487165 [Tanacetum coccineum]